MVRAALAGMLIALALPASAFSAQVDVTAGGDAFAADGQCTLREAISAANSDNTGPNGDCVRTGDGADVIEIPARSTPYTLARAGAKEDSNATGDLDVTAS